MKIAIVIMSDPENDREQALQRVFYALTLALEHKLKGDKVIIFFSGPGTRWPTELSKLSHPAHALYDSVREAVLDASYGDAAVLGVKESVESRGASLKQNYVPTGMLGTSDLLPCLSAEWNTVVCGR